MSVVGLVQKYPEFKVFEEDLFPQELVDIDFDFEPVVPICSPVKKRRTQAKHMDMTIFGVHAQACSAWSMSKFDDFVNGLNQEEVTNGQLEAIRNVRRKIKNRLSARASRQRQKDKIATLGKRVRELEEENAQLKKRVCEQEKLIQFHMDTTLNA